uniref:Acetylcholinesterase n=1 Tax=Parastrongyloides trichosuri TaxID=131310 RepID=A0A0N5A4K4_PARTI
MWVPEIKSGAVIVHFVGDSYSTLSASHDIYNGSVLAAFSKAIVVNVNFRLGAFGFAKVNSIIVHEYLGIPYAKPPTGSRRFNPPEKITPPTKNKKFKVNKGATACPQDNIFKATIPDLYVSSVYPTNISEDCLQLNIWVPKEKTGAVIVHFVGDSYSTLSASHDIFNGSVLAAFSKAIVVNANFRLGAFGFAKVNSINISGNMGLLDQQMALKWVYNNVELFGGKKTKITLLGVQAGSSSVQAHLYSKASSKYFSRIALISGVLENTWASRTSLFTKKLSRKLVKSLQCDKQVEDKINCLRNKTIYEIINQSYALRRSLHSTFGFSFALTRRDGIFFESDFTKSGYEKKDIDVLIGNSQNEGSFFLWYFFRYFGCELDIKTKPFIDNCKIDQDQFLQIVELFQEFYNKSSVWKDKVLDKYKTNNVIKTQVAFKFLSDFLFDCGMNQFLKKFTKENKRSTVYAYVFDHRSSKSLFPETFGTMHAAVIEYLFGHPYRYPNKYNQKKLSEEKAMSKNVIEIYGKFADKGKPSDKWKPYDSSTEKIMLLNDKYNKDSMTKYIPLLYKK